MAGLNVCVGIDAGTDTSKLGYADSLGTRIIARLEEFDPLMLREESEIFFDEPVFYCIVAVNSGGRKEDIRKKVLSSGFTDTSIITSHEAMSLTLGDKDKVLVYDFGASRSEFVVFGGREVIESVIVPDVCGSEFDKVFAEYLADRRLMKAVDGSLVREARRIKHMLSENESMTWHGLEIMREEFGRLIHFSVKRAGHTAQRLLRVHKPGRFVLSGGCAKIPAVREVFADMGAELQEDIIAEGASLKARALGRESRKESGNAGNASGLRELRAGMIELEDRLTRRQKDRIYMLFRQAEGINDAGIIAILENMLREIRQA